MNDKERRVQRLEDKSRNDVPPVNNPFVIVYDHETEEEAVERTFGPAGWPYPDRMKFCLIPVKVGGRRHAEILRRQAEKEAGDKSR